MARDLQTRNPCSRSRNGPDTNLASWIIRAFGGFIFLVHWRSRNNSWDVADDRQKHGGVRRLGQKLSRAEQAREGFKEALDQATHIPHPLLKVRRPSGGMPRSLISFCCTAVNSAS